MAGNSFGKLFRITTFGESHGVALGVTIDGCPSDLEIDQEMIALELARRRPGQSSVVSPRNESDQFEILSGLFEGKTTGAPITALFRNEDVKEKDYENLRQTFRPGHGDFTQWAKYGIRDYRGGGRISARETVGRVFAGSIAKQILAQRGVQIRGALVQMGSVVAKHYDWEQVESNVFRCVDPQMVEAMTAVLEAARRERDSLGGKIELQALGVPPGWGEPVFDKLEAAIAAGLMSIPAVKGIEIGAGFQAVMMKGSEMNDAMSEQGFLTNNHGGILGGISSGAPILVRLAVKPTSSIAKQQQTIDTNFSSQTIEVKGRHDPCVAIRAVVVAEAMLALVLLDFWLRDQASQSVKQKIKGLPNDQNKMTYGKAGND